MWPVLHFFPKYLLLAFYSHSFYVKRKTLTSNLSVIVIAIIDESTEGASWKSTVEDATFLGLLISVDFFNVIAKRIFYASGT